MTPAPERPAAELDPQLNTAGGGRTQDPAAARAAAEPASACPRGATGTPSPVRAPRPGTGGGTTIPSAGATVRASAPADGSTSPRDPGRTVAGTEAGSGSVGGTRDAAESPLPAGPAGRTYTIALPAGLELLSLNDRLHWRERHRRYQCIKFAAYVTARDARIPPLGRARIAVEYQPPDRRHRDADNPMAAAKAAVDGVVLAGCLEDDECPRYVTGIWATIGPVYPKGRLVLHLAEVTA